MTPRRFGCRLLLLIAAAAVLADAAAPAGRRQGLAAGKVLVASRDLPNRTFAETVILLVHHDEKSTMGLIVNRETRIRLSRILPEYKDATERLYAGGPVGRDGVLALMKAGAKPGDDARHVFADVYMISSKPLLDRTLARAEPGAVRVYLGYCGWIAGQLEAEMEAGVWEILPAQTTWVFDRDPASLWQRLIEKTELRIARLAGLTAPR